MVFQIDVLSLPQMTEIFSVKVNSEDSKKGTEEFVPLFLQYYQEGDLSVFVFVDEYLYRIIDIDVTCDMKDCLNIPYRRQNDICRFCLAEWAQEQIKEKL